MERASARTPFPQLFAQSPKSRFRGLIKVSFPQRIEHGPYGSGDHRIRKRRSLARSQNRFPLVNDHLTDGPTSAALMWLSLFPSPCENRVESSGSFVQTTKACREPHRVTVFIDGDRRRGVGQ